MRAELFPIPSEGRFSGTLATAPRPRGNDWLEDELADWRAAGVTVVVSMLTPDEEAELGLEAEAALTNAASMTYLGCPVPDYDVPTDPEGFLRVAETVAEQLRAGAGVLVHCRAGIGRSSLLAAAALHACGVPVDEALATISSARGRPVPDTKGQRAWLKTHCP